MVISNMTIKDQKQVPRKATSSQKTSIRVSAVGLRRSDTRPAVEIPNTKMLTINRRLSLLNAFLAICLMLSLVMIDFANRPSPLKSTVMLVVASAVTTIVMNVFLSIGKSLFGSIRRSISRM